MQWDRKERDGKKEGSGGEIRGKSRKYENERRSGEDRRGEEDKGQRKEGMGRVRTYKNMAMVFCCIFQLD